jgi:flavin-dependent dehydrogenase
MTDVLIGLLLICVRAAALRIAPVARSSRLHRPSMMAKGQGLTELLMSRLPVEAQTGGAGGQSTYQSLLMLDQAWSKLRSGELPPPRHVAFDEPGAPPETAEFDVVVAGGNIGILLATALALRGLRVAVLEAGQLRGREQDWNASRKEVMELVAAGVITADELEQVIGIEFNPVRCGFVGGKDVWLNDVLNVGVRPERLIALARARFEEAGGVIFEGSPLASVAVRPGAAVLTTAGGAVLRTRLVVDCMGQRSPIVAQMRAGAPPDGACVVVGSCADGFDAELNCFGDVIYSDTLIQPAGKADCPTQYFWEAFPASSSPTERTTYLFTYMDLAAERPSVLEIMNDYWRLLPTYQGVDLDRLELRRVLFGLFVSYKDSPLPVAFDRVMQVGDAGGLQSPLSFGGFGAITRHINRLTAAIEEALAADSAGARTLQRAALARINPYQANLRAAWLFQASMRPPTRPGAWSNDFISKVLVGTFEVMEERGESVMLPFLQDTLRADGLVATIGGLMLAKPLVSAEILLRLGPLPLADWFFHFAGMLAGSIAGSGPARALTKAAGPALPAGTRFALNRFVEGWQYGSGLDYLPPAAPSPLDPEALQRAKLAAAAARAFKPASAAVAAPAYNEPQVASRGTSLDG